MIDNTPVLNLDTLIEKPKITIDGQPYSILAPDALSVVDLHRVSAAGRRIAELMGGSDLDTLQQGELDALIIEISDFIMVDVPNEARAKLTGTQRMQIIEVFTSLPERKAMAEVKTIAANLANALTTIGEKSPRDSNASMAATPDGGLEKPQSH